MSFFLPLLVEVYVHFTDHLQIGVGDIGALEIQRNYGRE